MLTPCDRGRHLCFLCGARVFGRRLGWIEPVGPAGPSEGSGAKAAEVHLDLGEREELQSVSATDFEKLNLQD